MGGLEHLPKDVKLKLPVGIIAYTYRSGITVSSKMVQLLLPEGVFEIDVV